MPPTMMSKSMLLMIPAALPPIMPIIKPAATRSRRLTCTSGLDYA
jgi:hypothetical protein